MEVLTENSVSQDFIQANTKKTELEYLKEETIIPAFAKDNESTISHVEFIESVHEAADMVFRGESILKPQVRVSHPIKGRIPEAKGKPAKELLEHEKTLYYERMTFMIELDSVLHDVGGNKLSLSVGGVRSYHLDNLYNKKGPERFKLFIGFKNWVCTNLCVSTDGFLADLKVESSRQLLEAALDLFQGFQIERELQELQDLQKVHLTHNEFSHVVGRAKQYINLSGESKCNKPVFPLGDSQLSALIRGYYGVLENEGHTISLWDFYNLMTAANKSSYIDSHLDRNVESLRFSSSLANSLQTDSANWYLH